MTDGGEYVFFHAAHDHQAGALCEVVNLPILPFKCQLLKGVGALLKLQSFDVLFYLGRV